MYSMVMMVAMTGAPEVPQWGWNKGCSGCTGTPVVVVTHSSGCTGCGGCHGGMLGFGVCDKLKNCFGKLCHKPATHGCTGCTGGTVVVTHAAPECGTVVIPPTATMAPMATGTGPAPIEPKPMPNTKEMPKKVEAPKVEPAKKQ
jgi:hypothetical protein